MMYDVENDFMMYDVDGASEANRHRRIGHGRQMVAKGSVIVSMVQQLCLHVCVKRGVEPLCWSVQRYMVLFGGDQCGKTAG